MSECLPLPTHPCPHTPCVGLNNHSAAWRILRCFPGNCLIQPVCLALPHPINAAVPGSRQPCLLGIHRLAGVGNAARCQKATQAEKQPLGHPRTASEYCWGTLCRCYAVLPHSKSGIAEWHSMSMSPGMTAYYRLCLKTRGLCPFWAWSQTGDVMTHLSSR